MLSELEFFHELRVGGLVLAFHIREELAPLSHHHEESPPRVVVFRVLLQMIGERLDLAREERDLYLGRSGVPLVR